eukprot:CAMPEP_0183353572 /NCGR_PEP_ID=MMETSP0164_2-20130417/33751_1 /TAXON_ID=221442 /ORGANISM="Coccolithus pelagicus ssp braarudi, Strain PLY182g" /LENGTH=85 /DNA_ID=CAMNT_0025526265 /DNA_START=184 /DNA_END=438 /DNA_ORIENTATION=+
MPVFAPPDVRVSRSMIICETESCVGEELMSAVGLGLSGLARKRRMPRKVAGLTSESALIASSEYMSASTAAPSETAVMTNPLGGR